ncbi:hypothetical protein ACUW6V_003643 [Cronobacter sp. 153480017-3]
MILTSHAGTSMAYPKGYTLSWCYTSDNVPDEKISLLRSSFRNNLFDYINGINIWLGGKALAYFSIASAEESVRKNRNSPPPVSTTTFSQRTEKRRVVSTIAPPHSSSQDAIMAT